ncbi:MAG: lysophospholipid acyltransferase family protein, partial [Myxococcaceae bacterium]|nr:lysophospholipid acyltransferase family protein [Myxococcaceae bacterium]
LLGGEGPPWRLLAAVVGALPVLAASGALGTALAWVGAALAGLGVFPAIVATLGLRLLLGRGLSPELAASTVVGTALLLGVGEALLRSRARGPSRWTGKSRGGVVGHWIFYQLTRWFGIRPAYALLYPVSLYFLLVLGTGRRASMQFLERALGPTHWAGRLARTYRHFLAFARTLVDRFVLSLHGPGLFRLEENGLHHIRTAAAEGRGAILLTAHMGNWDIAAGLLGDVSADVAVVAFRGEQERLARFLEKAHGRGPRVIAVGDELLGSLEMVRALREGTLLAVQGDRALNPRVVRVPFLGREAPFPVGPFVLAAVSGAPLIATFSTQVGPASYRFVAAPPMRVSFAPGQSRDAQLRGWVEQYVRQLEALVREHPYQWFNFYDFWEAEPPSASSGGRPESPAARG